MRDRRFRRWLRAQRPIAYSRSSGLVTPKRPRSLLSRLVEVKACRRSEARVSADARGRKNELPPPLRRRVRERPFESVREDDAAKTRGEVPLMRPPHIQEVRLKAFADPSE